MKKPGNNFQYFFLLAWAGIFFVVLAQFVISQSAQITTTVGVSVCGNGNKDTGEECDNSDLSNQTCVSKGYKSGTLSCKIDCSFNTANCSNDNGGGGGGGGAPTPANNIILSGWAYPMSLVTVLKDGQTAVTTIAGPDASFYIALSGLSSGSYMFSVIGEDDKGLKSSLFTFPVTITSGITTKIGGIFIAPTITVDKTELKRGETLTIFGKTAPSSNLTVSVNSPQELFLYTKSDNNGVYLYNFDTSVLNVGQHATKSKSASVNGASGYSKTVGFTVDASGQVIPSVGATAMKGDLNGDDGVNLIDFSIAAYWYKRPLDAKMKEKEAKFLNGDGKINLVDFSIMAYNWTG